MSTHGINQHVKTTETTFKDICDRARAGDKDCLMTTYLWWSGYVDAKQLQPPSKMAESLGKETRIMYEQGRLLAAAFMGCGMYPPAWVVFSDPTPSFIRAASAVIHRMGLLIPPEFDPSTVKEDEEPESHTEEVTEISCLRGSVST